MSKARMTVGTLCAGDNRNCVMAMSGDFANTKTVRFADKARQLARFFSDSYRPELYYMRGPGPKWREKHGLPGPDAHHRELGLPQMSDARA